MKKIDKKIIVIVGLLVGIAYLIMNPIEVVKEVPVEIVKKEIVIDTVIVNKVVEKKVIEYVTKFETKIQTDTIVKIVEKPIEVIKTVYKKRYVDKFIDVPRPKVNKWFLGFGYQFDKDNYFSGSNIKLVHKFKSDKMFSLDLGYRNDLLDEESGVSKLRPYIGASIYFRLDKDKNQQLFILKANLAVKEEEVNLNKFLANNWSIVVGLLAFIFTAGTIFAQFTALQSELSTVHERLDKKIKVINELEDRIVGIEKEIQYEKGFLEGKGN